MQLLQIIGIGFIATTIIVLLRTQKPEFAMQASIVTGIVIFLLVASQLSGILNALGTLADRAEIKPVYFSTILKVTGIAYITEFGADICRDAGESSIASKIELAGKVTIVALSVPIIVSLLDLIVNIMP